MARLTLSQPGEDVFIGGADVEVIGTASSGEVINVFGGNIRLDASFNQGGDTVVLPGLATSYTAYREGSVVILTRNDGAVSVRIPFGTAGLELQFDGGDSRVLLFDTSSAQLTIEGQAISSISTSPTTLVADGAAPPPTYDVIGTNASVAEGDSGTKLLTFTINLDRAVSGSPLTLNYATSDGTAVAGSDYAAATGTVTIPIGQQSGTVSVVINGDGVFEADETFTLNLSGGALRNGPETLVGTITNDDSEYRLSAGVNTLQGTAGGDIFSGKNSDLGPGDSITDNTPTDNDLVALEVDASTTNRNFTGFTLNGIENVWVTNISGQAATYDLSNSAGILTVMSLSSTDSVSFNGLTSNATVVVKAVTGAATVVQATYQAGVTAGASTTVNLLLDRSTAAQVILGTVGAGSTGIETVNLSATGTSTIGTLGTQLSTLNIAGGGDVTISNPLATSIRTVNATNAGRVTVDFTGNDAAGTGVTFTSGSGNDVVRSGQAADNISTGLGDDTVTDEGGNDTINTGAGNDTITLLGAGNVTIDAGADNDTINILSFDNLDIIQGGTGFDTINVTDGSINAIGTFSGIEVINFLSDGDGEDQGLRVVDANAPTVGNVLTINAGGFIATENFFFLADTVTAFSTNITTGAGNDIIDLSNNLADVVSSGAGVDTITLAGGDTASAGAGNDIVVVRDGNNVVNGGEDDDLIQLLGNGVVTLNGDNGNDVFEIQSSAFLTSADTVNGGAGTDTISLKGGTYVDAQFTNVTGIEILTASAGASNVTLGLEAQDGGIRTVNLADASNDILDARAYTVGLTVISAGGDDVITTGAGADIIVGGVGRDTLTGGAGADTFRYLSVEDSRITSNGDGRDVITDFVAGTDKIDLLQLQSNIGQQIRFAGDFGTFAQAQAALVGTQGDSFLDVAFARDQSVLFVDIDNNGVLDNNDLQIVLTNLTGTLSATDVNNPHVVTGPQSVSGDYGEVPQAAAVIPELQYSNIRLIGIYDSQHIA